MEIYGDVHTFLPLERLYGIWACQVMTLAVAASSRLDLLDIIGVVVLLLIWTCIWSINEV